MVDPTLLWITHGACGRHEMGPGHPECPERLDAVERAVAASPLAALRQVSEAGRADRDLLARVHEGAYVDAILAAAPAAGYARLDGDTVMNPHSAEAALRAAGGCVQAVDALLDGTAGQAFCAVRPPGHHAERSNAMGFCLFDNVAVAAAQARERGLDRVAILDFDVHYGNGTVDIFRGRRDVFVANTYQYPLYPFWANGGGAKNLADAPLDPGTGSRGFRDAVRDAWWPALKAFAPQLIIVSAGFDAHREDPLANLAFEDDDYRWIGRQLREVAERPAQGRVLAALEGGYAVGALGRSVVAFLEGLLGSAPAQAAQQQ